MKLAAAGRTAIISGGLRSPQKRGVGCIPNSLVPAFPLLYAMPNLLVLACEHSPPCHFMAGGLTGASAGPTLTQIKGVDDAWKMSLLGGWGN
jgi:hypothetical protein